MNYYRNLFVWLAAVIGAMVMILSFAVGAEAVVEDPQEAFEPPVESPDLTVRPALEHDVSLIPVCAPDGTSATLDVVIESEGAYSITVDGTTVEDVDAPTSGLIGDLPLSGAVGVVHNDSNTVVAGGTYELVCEQPEPVTSSTRVEREQLPNTGVGSVLIGLMGLGSLGAGGVLLRKH